MFKGNLATNTTTSWYIVRKSVGVHITCEGTFDSGTIALQKRVNGNTYPLRDANGTAITHAAAFDRYLELRRGDEVRLSLSGAGSPAIDWSIAGELEATG